MSLKDMDIEHVMRRLADRRIDDAMAEGKFDNLPGKGLPLDIEPAPADENARLMWWALKILRQNDVTPDEVVWRKQIETLKEELGVAQDEKRVRTLCIQINTLVTKLNTLGTNAMNGASAVTGVSLDKELARLRNQK